jgi:hypothetical protein
MPHRLQLKKTTSPLNPLSQTERGLKPTYLLIFSPSRILERGQGGEVKKPNFIVKLLYRGHDISCPYGLPD